VLGIVFGAVLGSANAYLGLKVGLTISTSIPLAVIMVAAFAVLRPLIGKSSILDVNIGQTAGSASSSLASGVVFTIPALFMWGLAPVLGQGYVQIALLALCGGVLGILFMIPLRPFLIVREHKNLPYPEGTASAAVLVAADEGGTRARPVFVGLLLGSVYKLALSLGKFWPDEVDIKIPVLKKGILYASTELGDYIVWDLRIFNKEYCGLMQEIWRLVPTVWEVGLPVKRQPPKDHLCSK